MTFSSHVFQGEPSHRPYQAIGQAFPFPEAVSTRLLTFHQALSIVLTSPALILSMTRLLVMFFIFIVETPFVLAYPIILSEPLHFDACSVWKKLKEHSPLQQREDIGY